MPIKGITEKYRPVRQGKIHLGVMKKRGDIEYPSEVAHFVVPPELNGFYGEAPKILNVTLPSARFDKNFDEYLEKVFPQYLKRYKGGKDYGMLVCKGDADTANTWDEEHGGMKETPCPCDEFEKGNCRRIGILRIRIQEIASFNIYQITTSSYNSIVNINSFIRDLLEHCYVVNIDPSSIKLILRRNQQSVQRVQNGTSKSSSHYILEFDLDPRFYKDLDDIKKDKSLTASPEIKKLTPPDESKDELFYPKNGFIPEEDSPDGESEQSSEDSGFAEEAELNDLKESLFGKVAEFEGAGGRVNQATNKRLLALKDKGTAEEIKAAIEHFKTEKEKLNKK